MPKQILAVFSIIMVFAAGCSGDGPADPTIPELPAAPIPAGPPVSPPAPPHPAPPPDGSATLVPEGVYYLSAPITAFDPAWGYDLTDNVYRATLRIQHHPTDRWKLSGRFSDFRLVDASGTSGYWSHAGSITGIVDASGRVTLELRNDAGNFSWWGGGEMVEKRIEGTWGRGGHLGGPFSAEAVERAG